MKRSISLGVFSAGLVFLAFLFGLGVAGERGEAPLADTLVALQASSAPASIDRANELSESFVNIARAVTPAVVRIESRQPPFVVTGPGAPPADPGQPPAQPGPSQSFVTGGSGIVISPDGYILTNNHVIAGASEIRIVLSDSRRFDARVVGRDPTTDVAVLKIDANSLPNVRFGDSEGTLVGEWVLAVGNPGFGGSRTLAFTVTSGIISAKGRGLDIIRQDLKRRGHPAADFAIGDFIQTDAVINPGNSGGPLVNLEGEVIGLNTAIASGTGFYQGYGFAIPINLARGVAQDLIRYGEPRRAMLGVVIRDIDPTDAEAHGLSEIAGALIDDFAPESPAHEAGLRRGDVIVAVDGTSVDHVARLQRMIARYQPGDNVRITVIRYGDRQTFSVELGEAPIPGADSNANENRPATMPSIDGIGVRIGQLTAERARQFGYAGTGGAVIVKVAPFGPAYEAQLNEGLRILEIDREAVRSAEQAESILDSLDSGSVVSLLLEAANGATRIVNIRVP